MISKRFSAANNPYIEDYSSEEPTKYLLYLDANNLYGWAMKKELPVSDFKFLEKEALHTWEKYENCILDVDIDVPKHLQKNLRTILYVLGRKKTNSCVLYTTRKITFVILNILKKYCHKVTS